MAVVLILVVLWAVVLGPPLVRRLMERRSSESIDSFHHSLHLLERTGPKLIQPAYRLDVAGPGGSLGVGPGGPFGDGRPNLVLLKAMDPGEGGGEAVVDQVSGGRFERLGAPPQSSRADLDRPTLAERAEEYRRQRNRRRRRDIVLGLGGTAFVTGLAGIAHSLHLLWVLTGLSVVALLAYGVLFSYARSLSSGAGRHPRPQSAARRPSRPVAVPDWDEPPEELPEPTEDWDRREAAAAGYPGAWDDLEEVSPARPWTEESNVVAMNHPEAGTGAFPEEDAGTVEVRYGVRLYRDRAAGAH